MDEVVTFKAAENYNYQKFDYFKFLKDNGIKEVNVVRTLNGREVFYTLKNYTDEYKIIIN